MLNVNIHSTINGIRMTKYVLFGSVGRRKSLLSKNSMAALLRFGKMPLNPI